MAVGRHYVQGEGLEGVERKWVLGRMTKIPDIHRSDPQGMKKMMMKVSKEEKKVRNGTVATFKSIRL